MRRVILIVYKTISILLSLLTCSLTNLVFRLKLWLNNVNFGKNVTSSNAVSRINISKDAFAVRLGNNVAFNCYDGPSWNSKCSIVVRSGGELIIGDNCGFNGVFLCCAKRIIIGNHVSIGGGTMIFDTDFHPINHIKRRSTFDGTGMRPITIEDDVFVGAHCIISKGVTIGARSVIAAGSVVVKNIPSDEVWGGNPARFIRKI